MGLIPHRAPWSVEFLTYPGQAERIGRPVEELVSERLGKAGCTVADIPDLQKEADRHHHLALPRTTTGAQR